MNEVLVYTKRDRLKLHACGYRYTKGRTVNVRLMPRGRTDGCWDYYAPKMEG